MAGAERWKGREDEMLSRKKPDRQWKGSHRASEIALQTACHSELDGNIWVIQ